MSLWNSPTRVSLRFSHDLPTCMKSTTFALITKRVITQNSIYFDQIELAWFNFRYFPPWREEFQPEVRTKVWYLNLRHCEMIPWNFLMNQLKLRDCHDVGLLEFEWGISRLTWLGHIARNTWQIMHCVHTTGNCLFWHIYRHQTTTLSLSTSALSLFRSVPTRPPFVFINLRQTLRDYHVWHFYWSMGLHDR